jgi:hypothetical protein
MRSALIVANYEYADPGLRRLRAPASDAQALAGVLSDPGIGGFEVRTLLNEPAHEVNLAVEEFFADRRPDDLLLMHFSSHGVKDEDGELYFASSNTMLRRLGATAVAADFVNRRMNRSRSRRVVLLLDCCYAGAFERGMTARAGTGVSIEERFGGQGRAVITASSAMEYAFEGDQLADSRELAPSVFTSALVEGLETGEADRDQDGMVALDELYDYVYDKVRRATPNQTPGKWTFGVQGDLYIARRSRPVTTPAPLPPELQAAIDSPFAGVRTGAVQELQRLLAVRHAGLALAARLALKRLTEDDSRAVSAAATAALGPQDQAGPPQVPPRLELSTSVVDFGRLPQHSASPEQRVRLGNAGGGTLNARAATQAGWLNLRQVGDELVIAVETKAVNDHEGVITIESEGGSASIRVLARVDPMALPVPQDAVTKPDKEPATKAQVDRLLLAAGGLAAVGAALTFAALFPADVGDFHQTSLPALVWTQLILSALQLSAGICLFVPRTRRLIGPGLLLGAVAVAPIGPIYDITVLAKYGQPRAGLWLDFAGGVILVLAAFVAGVALARTGEVRFARGKPEDVPARLVVLLGVVGAVTLLIQVPGDQLLPGRGQGFVPGEDWLPLIWVSAMALIAPAAAAVAVPRQFGLALLAGWIGCGVAVVTFYTGFQVSLFGYTLLALLAVIIPFARAATPESKVSKQSGS